MPLYANYDYLNGLISLSHALNLGSKNDLTASLDTHHTQPLSIKRVIFNDPATVIYWSDGTKTVVKCKNEEFDKEKGLAMACMKKLLGNKGHYYEEVKKWVKEETK